MRRNRPRELWLKDSCMRFEGLEEPPQPLQVSFDCDVIQIWPLKHYLFSLSIINYIIDGRTIELRSGIKKKLRGWNWVSGPTRCCLWLKERRQGATPGGQIWHRTRRNLPRRLRVWHPRSQTWLRLQRHPGQERLLSTGPAELSGTLLDTVIVDGFDVTFPGKLQRLKVS